jgi:hypothetical protein
METTRNHPALELSGASDWKRSKPGMDLRKLVGHPGTSRASPGMVNRPKFGDSTPSCATSVP